MKSPRTSAEGAETGLTEAEISTAFVSLAGKNLLLAVSGGPDSTALLGMVAAWGGAASVHVATVDHGLRVQSRQEAEAVGAFAAGFGFSHHILVWQGEKPAARLQETAREARYDLLAACAARIGASHVLTAHTLDDQAETLLFRLVRGSGPAGLVGMVPERVLSNPPESSPAIHARPLLNFSKSRLVATCRERNWPYFEDPSNQNEKFARVRMRRLLPLLAGEGLDARALARLSQRMAKAEAALDAQILTLWPDMMKNKLSDQMVLDGALLLRQPRAIVERVVSRALNAVENSRWQRLERVEKCCEDLIAAAQAGEAIRRSLGLCLVHLTASCELIIARAPERKRGMQRN